MTGRASTAHDPARPIGCGIANWGMPARQPAVAEGCAQGPADDMRTVPGAAARSPISDRRNSLMTTQHFGVMPRISVLF